MWTLIKVLILARPVLYMLAFLAVLGGFLILGIGRMISDAGEHRHLMQHNVDDYHRLNNWRLK